jgi:hypothetical protein
VASRDSARDRDREIRARDRAHVTVGPFRPARPHNGSRQSAVDCVPSLHGYRTLATIAASPQTHSQDRPHLASISCRQKQAQIVRSLLVAEPAARPALLLRANSTTLAVPAETTGAA